MTLFIFRRIFVSSPFEEVKTTKEAQENFFFSFLVDLQVDAEWLAEDLPLTLKRKVYKKRSKQSKVI